MAAQSYSQYFNIDEKYYPVVTKKLIDEGKVRWDSFYPHETFVQLLHQAVDMLSGKEDKSIWVEGSYGTGKSHAALALKSLLETTDEAVEGYFNEYGLSSDLCNKFLQARKGKMVVIHRIGSSNIKDDHDLVWCVQNSISQALKEQGIENTATFTVKDAFINWVEEKERNKTWFDGLVREDPMHFGGMGADQIIQKLKEGKDNSATDTLIANLTTLCHDNGILAMDMDAEKLADWIPEVISANKIDHMVFVWDEFSEFFKNNRNSLTGFQTLTQISMTSPFYFVLVTHESQGLLPKDKDPNSDSSKISNRFFEPHVRIELPDNMAFMLMAQAMKETNDSVMRGEWNSVKSSLNGRLTSVRNKITDSARKHSKAGNKNALSDDDLKKIVPLHPYAALVLKHISYVFTSSQRSMFEFITARDPEEGNDTGVSAKESGNLACRAFKWYINHHSAMGQDNLMTVDMLWDFFNAKAGGNMNADALEILSNFDTLNSEYNLNPEQQRVLKTVLLMNAICTRVQDAEMLIPTYENIDLAFSGVWAMGKARSIAMSLVHRDPPLSPVLFEEPMQDGTMRVIPKKTGGVDIDSIKEQIRSSLSAKVIAENVQLQQELKLPACLEGHFATQMLYVNLNSPQTFTSSYNSLDTTAKKNPDKFFVGIMVALTDNERTEVAEQIQKCIKNTLPVNLLLIDASTNTFSAYIENYLTNRAYSQYYLKSDKKQADLFGSYAQKNMDDWQNQVLNGEFRLYSNATPSGFHSVGFSGICDKLKEINHDRYPLGLEQYNVQPTMFARSAMAQGAECGLSQIEKGQFSATQNEMKLSTALRGAWKVEGKWWEDPAKSGLLIVELKKIVEKTVKEGFSKNGRINVIDICRALTGGKVGLVPSNLSAFVMGFLLKEYACDKYFWSNGLSRPMTIDLMKAAIKNAMDCLAVPSPKYKPEAIVMMSDELVAFLSGTAAIFNASPEECGSVDNAAGIVRIGMKKMSFPIWCIKYIIGDNTPNADNIKSVIDKYLGIANIKNFAQETTESDLAQQIGSLMRQDKSIVESLKSLFTDPKSKEGMKAYLTQYCGGKLPQLALVIKDEGRYLDVLGKKFDAEESKWLWSQETVNSKIDEVICEYNIVAASRNYEIQSASLDGCLKAWKAKVANFKIPCEVIAVEKTSLKELLCLLRDISQNYPPKIPDGKKPRFLELLNTKKDEFASVYSGQVSVFKSAASVFLTGLNDEDISELFTDYIETGKFADSSEKYYSYVTSKVEEFSQKQTKKQLENLWKAKTGTQSPMDWSEKYSTPILCMFSDNDRQEAREIFGILMKARPSTAEAERAKAWLNNGTFYDSLASRTDRDESMKARIVGDNALLLQNLDAVRQTLRTELSTIAPYNWIDNSIVQNKINEMALKKYKTGGSVEAEAAVANLDVDALRDYVCDLIKTDMTVGIAILKRKKK